MRISCVLQKFSMENSIIIGVDTGNRCIKTANNIFVSGVIESHNPPIQRKNVLAYDGKYYMLTQKRISYLQDKTQNDEYFALTLFAIAEELKIRRIATEAPVSMILGVGLPPSHIARLKEAFKKYFSRGKVSFTYNDDKYELVIEDVYVFSQGYAAIFNDFEEISGFKKSFVIDIGGYTTDIIQLNNGIIDPNICESINAGMIILYNNIKREIEKKYGNSPDENQIDGILDTGEETNPQFPVMDIINSSAEKYVFDLIYKLREMGVELNFSKGVFIGGGAQRLKKWIDNCDMVSNPFYVLNINANAQGYEACIEAIQSR